jgi:hypothetical protein
MTRPQKEEVLAISVGVGSGSVTQIQNVPGKWPTLQKLARTFTIDVNPNTNTHLQ